jgi:hypothetical protein
MCKCKDSTIEMLVSMSRKTCRHNAEFHNLNTRLRQNVTSHVAVRSLCNFLYPAEQAATVVAPKVTEPIKSGFYGFGNTKNRQLPFIRPSGFSHTGKLGCEGNTYTA